MKNKIVGIFVCALFVLSALTGAVSTNVLTNTNLEYESQYGNQSKTTETTTVWLKFFVHDECTKNISQMVADCNDIFNGGGDSSRNEDGITQFGTNGTITTLPDSDFDNMGTTAGRTGLLRKLKSEYDNCSKGINIVICPSGHFTSNGLTYFNKEKGVSDKPYGGVILRDTCNQDQMNKTLAHELLHALGLSHEQVKWLNTSSGEIESKPIGTKIVNGSGPGSDRNIPAGSLGYPVPPHGYAYYDKDGDCDCEDDDEEQPKNAAGRKIWDIDGNCAFGEVNDTDNLLWGRADRTNTNLTPEQKKSIFDHANNTPGYRRQTVGQPVSVPQKDTTNSKSLKDILGDIIKKFLDIIGGLITIFWEHDYIYFGLELLELLPEDTYANYYYYIDKDNDPTTGDPGGYDLLIDLLVRPDYIVSALSEWDPYYGMFIEVAELDWNIAIGVEDSEDDEDCNELEIEGMVIQWEVPIELLNLELTGDMRITAVATDGEGRDLDSSPDLIISKERAIVPVLNLNPFNGKPGDSITCNGYDYTPNTDVKVEFNGIHVASTVTDSNGDFTTSFNVLSLPQGYYTVNAYDAKGKFHIRMFKVENQAPNKPGKPSGQTQGKTGTSYPYSTVSIDPNGDKLKYGWDWIGDDKVDEWDDNGGSYYNSGATITTSHAWSKAGTYNVKVKAEDIYGTQSVWSDPLTVTMPRNRALTNSLFLRLLEQFPLLERLLNLQELIK